MKLNKTYGYLILSIKDDKEVVVEETGEKFPPTMTPAENENVYKEVRKKLLENEAQPKFVLFDFKFETKDGKRQKLVFLNWCSDNANCTKKMLQGSTCESLKKNFTGLAGSIQANDHEELEYKEIMNTVQSWKK